MLTDFVAQSPLSVGNGEFAFTADVTGLQTFPERYEKAMPLCTQAQWGWHSFPNRPPGEYRFTDYDTHGRLVPYPTDGKAQPDLYRYLRENPHRLHLGQLGFVLDAADVQPKRQQLDLWTGTLHSEFTWRGELVTVETCVHPTLDAIAVRIRSSQPLPARLAFPYGSGKITAADWSQPDRHRTDLINSHELRRTLDNDRYAVTVGQVANITREGPHAFRWTAPAFVVRFTQQPATEPIPTVDDAFARCAAHWAEFWKTGGAIELSHTGDAQAKELERRIVLSQYQTAIQCAGSLPPQETGLTCNSWYGKFHLEMHWWHAAHFTLWGRAPLLERSLAYYQAILPEARKLAQRQGYAGVRWPKMTGPDGHDSPSPIGPLLIWLQPHPIAMAELVYQSHPTRATLDRYHEIVFQTADFLASYAYWDGRRFVLGPPVIPAQENHPPRETWNPTFELEYFAQALGIAQQWRQRLGLPVQEKWDNVRTHLSELPVKDGVYLAHENCPQTFTERNRDHPSMLAALGVLRGSKVDRETMRRTLQKVFAEWKFADTWGWDYPVMAMTATRLGEPDTAIRALLLDTPKNHWLPNGHTYQRPDLPLYLPSNGGLLAAAALMAVKPQGFPAKWQARAEGIRAFL